MAKKQRPKFDAKKVKAEAREVAPVEVTTDATDAKIIADQIIKILQETKAIGWIIGVADEAGKIVPHVGAGSVGDLLTIKYALDKEIGRLIDSINDPK